LKGHTNVQTETSKDRQTSRECKIAPMAAGVKVQYCLSETRIYLLGLCRALRCQPFDDIMSFTSNMSTTSEANATTVISGFPITNNPGISPILHKP